MIKSLLSIASIYLAVISFNASASVIKTLNGIEYEWLELTATAGLSRDQVEASIAAASPGDLLYGYEFASVQLVMDLFWSYADWDFLDGYHGNPVTTLGLSNYFVEFGTLFTLQYANPLTLTPVDGFPSITYDTIQINSGLYGTTEECGGVSFTCLSDIRILSQEGANVGVWQYGIYGWNDTVSASSEIFTSSSIGSHLVRTSAVPVPAALWLFGSGLIGLIGIARRKKA